MPEIWVRPAREGDFRRLWEIYGWYVAHTAVTFECACPTLGQFSERLARLMARFPCLVAEEDGVVQGYAHGNPFHPREAYRFCAETTIYLHPQARGRGLGRRLQTALEQALSERGFRNLYACIGYPDIPDEYLTMSSVAFHTRMGYRQCGYFHHCGWKFERWYSMVWMEKELK